MAEPATPQLLERQGRRPASAAPGFSVPDKPNTIQRSAMQQYQRAQVETASPIRLVVMLYDGAIRFCSVAQDAMRKRDLEAQNTNLIKAQRIIGELMSSLNRDEGGVIASNLFRIYSHLLEEMVTANLYDKSDVLDHVLSVLQEMRASWVEIDNMTIQDTSSIAQAPSRESREDTPALAPPAASAQQRLKAKTARLLVQQGGTEAKAVPSRLGDRNA